MDQEQMVKQRYFDWLCHFVYDNVPFANYTKLLTFLNETPFTYILPRDENRYSDGIGLRYRFGRETDIREAVVANFVDRYECSVLEMLIALCLRCEESIMSNERYGDRTGQWFWNMLVNLGLGKMTDDHFDIQEARAIVSRFLNRQYGPNGEGGIVRLYDHGDLRNIEIWYQVMWYLNEF